LQETASLNVNSGLASQVANWTVKNNEWGCLCHEVRWTHTNPEILSVLQLQKMLIFHTFGVADNLSLSLVDFDQQNIQQLEWALGRAHTFAYHTIGYWIMKVLALVACQLDTNLPCYGKKKILTFSWPWPWPDRSQNRIKWSPDNNQSSHQISWDSV